MLLYDIHTYGLFDLLSGRKFHQFFKKRAASRNQQTVIASYPADGISEVRLSEFKFQPHTLLKSVCASCKGARLDILLLPFPPDLLPPPPLVSCSSFLHELLSFPPADNESCCLWCQGEPGGGNNGAETKCQPQCTRTFLCVFPVCVCVIVWARVYLFSRVIKDPICHTLPRTHTQSPYEPLQRN